MKRDREVAQMRHPPKGETWVHVSSLEEPSGNVWAVQHHVGGKPVYREAAHVQIDAPLLTRFFGRSSKKQPRAVIVVTDAVVVVRGNVAFITRRS